MEECKIPVWARDKMFQPQKGGFPIPRTAIFHRRGSFQVPLVAVGVALLERVNMDSA